MTGPVAGCFMIAASFGQIVSISGHDHDRRPKCLNITLRHDGQNGRHALLEFPPVPIGRGRGSTGPKP